MSKPLRVIVWNEFRHERSNPKVAEIYPDGMHIVIAEFLKQQGHEVRTATLDDDHHGLGGDALSSCDVLVWWGHIAHAEVSDETVDRIQERVLEGMGLVVLHSGHFSKIFKRLMGTGCDLKWREVGERERLWVVAPSHPIVAGLPERFELENEEMYGEHFDIPAPDELVLLSWFQGGEVFRSGCCFYRGRGRIFYFRPGHETYPTYQNPLVQKVICNGVQWAAPIDTADPKRGNQPPLEVL